MTAATERVRLEVDGAVATVRFGGADRVPTLDPEGMRVTRDHVRAVVDDPAIRVLMLRGAAGVFCAGADLGAVLALGQREAHDVVTGWAGPAMNETVTMLHTSRLVTVAVVEGSAAGGGLGLALACDVLLAAESAVLRTGFLAAGLTPDSGVPFFLARAVGQRRALALCLRNERIPARRALELGLATEVVADDELDAALAALVGDLLAAAPRASAGTKALLRAAVALPLEQQLDLEIRTVCDQIAHPEFAEGAAAFLERRAPVWPARA